MKAIILAGGEGKRLKSVTGDLPKPMVPILGKPVLERIIDLLRTNGITEICATLKYSPEPITNYFGDGRNFGVHLTYSYETEPLGTAGSVKQCKDFWQDSDFLVISGDAACDFDLSYFIEEHRDTQPAVSIALYPHPEPLQYGLALSDKNGRIIHFTEKPTWEQVVTNLINTGIYLITPHAMDYVPKDSPYDFGKELFPSLLAYGEEIRGIPMDGYWCDIGTPRSYYQCCLDALDGKYKIPDTVEESTVAPAAQRSTRTGSQVRQIPCNDRAGIMRAVTSVMMELGADFADGVVFADGNGYVRIHPDSADSVILVESNTREIADTFARFVKRQIS